MSNTQVERQSNSAIDKSTGDLIKILKGEVGDLNIPRKTIISGKKIRNNILRRFVEVCEKENHFEPQKIIQILLAFDEAVEKEMVTEDLFEAIRKDPSIINNHFSKKKEGV